MVKKLFCQYCLQCFFSIGMTQKRCLAINHSKSILLSEECTYINFQNFKRWTKSLIRIYGDFQRVSISLTDNINFDPNTKKSQVRIIICSYDCKLITNFLMRWSNKVNIVLKQLKHNLTFNLLFWLKKIIKI